MENTHNYWMMLCNPDKWFGVKVVANAKVNSILYNLDTFAWTTGKRSFKEMKAGDLGIIKVGNDHRNKACRTIDDELVDKLEAGIYTIVEFIEKDGQVLHYDKNGIERVHFKVIKNLFKENSIIDKLNTEKLLGKYYKSFSSTMITKEIFERIHTEKIC